MIYEIKLMKNNPTSFCPIWKSFLVEWDNQIDNIKEFLILQGFQDRDIIIEEFPILKFSQFRKELSEAEWD